MKKGCISATLFTNQIINNTKRIQSMKKTFPTINIPPPKIGNLPPEEVSLADALAMDDRTIMALVDLIFSQKDPSQLPS